MIDGFYDVEKQLNACPGCRTMPRISVNAYFGECQIDCDTTACPLATEPMSRKSYKEVDEAVATWNKKALGALIRPAIIDALVKAGIYKIKRTA